MIVKVENNIIFKNKLKIFKSNKQTRRKFNTLSNRNNIWDNFKSNFLWIEKRI